MTRESIEAIYEHGTFRLITPVDLKLIEGHKVRLVVEAIEKPGDVLDPATRVYDGLTDDQIDSIEQVIRRREDFFGERTSV